MAERRQFTPTDESYAEYLSSEYALCKMAGNVLMAEMVFKEWERVTSESDGYIVDD